MLPTQAQYKLLVFPFKSFSTVANKPAVLYTYTPDTILDISSLLALSCCLIIQIPPLIHLMCSCGQNLDFDLAMSQQEYWDLLLHDLIPASHAPLSLACSCFTLLFKPASRCLQNPVPPPYLCPSAHTSQCPGPLHFSRFYHFHAALESFCPTAVPLQRTTCLTLTPR